MKIGILFDYFKFYGVTSVLSPVAETAMSL